MPTWNKALPGFPLLAASYKDHVGNFLLRFHCAWILTLKSSVLEEYYNSNNWQKRKILHCKFCLSDSLKCIFICYFRFLRSWFPCKEVKNRRKICELRTSHYIIISLHHTKSIFSVLLKLMWCKQGFLELLRQPLGTKDDIHYYR